MNESDKYPENVDFSRTLSPKLIKLWDEAMARLKKRRIITILVVLVCFPLLFYLWIALVDVVNPLILPIVTAATLGFIGRGMVQSVGYWVSDDRQTARFILRHGFDIRQVVEERFLWPLREMKTGCGGLLGAIPFILMSPFLLTVHWVFSSHLFFTKLIWLPAFSEFDQRLKNPPAAEERRHVRGTEMLPAAPLSGVPPESEFVESEGNNELIKVLDGRLGLLSDGGLVLEGGVAFDVHSTFQDTSVGGLVLTRKDPGLLRVRFDGKDHAFFFNGREWSEV